MPLGPPPPPKGGLDDPSLDPGGLSSRKNEEIHEGLFNNQMGPMGQPLVLPLFAKLITKKNFLIIAK